MDELAETAKTIKDKTGSAGICLLAKDNAGGWHFSNIAWAFGATLCTQNDDGTFTSHLDSDEAIAAMEYVKSLKWDYDVLTADPLLRIGEPVLHSLEPAELQCTLVQMMR